MSFRLFPLSAADLVLTYFMNRPHPNVLTEDGNFNFLPFEMIPDTIVVNGLKGLVGDDGLSIIPIKELVHLGYLKPSAGTPADPFESKASCWLVSNTKPYG